MDNEDKQLSLGLDFGLDFDSMMSESNSDTPTENLGLDFNELMENISDSTEESVLNVFKLDVPLQKKTVTVYFTNKLEVISQFISIDESYQESENVYVLPTCMRVSNLNLFDKLTKHGVVETEVKYKDIMSSYEKDKFETIYLNLQLGGGKI